MGRVSKVGPNFPRQFPPKNILNLGIAFAPVADMTHDERCRLIAKPFPTVRTYGGCGHGGVSFESRVYAATLEQLDRDVSYSGGSMDETRGLLGIRGLPRAAHGFRNRKPEVK